MPNKLRLKLRRFTELDMLGFALSSSVLLGIAICAYLWSGSPA